MLNTQDAITVKGLKSPVDYTRIYFEYGPNDEVEVLTKKSEGQPLKLEDGTVWSGTTPKNDTTSVTDESELVQEAIAFLLTEVPADSTNPSRDAWLSLLAYASKGYDSTVRNNLQAKNRPAEILSGDKAIEALAKTLVKVGVAKDLATGMVMAKANLASAA